MHGFRNPVLVNAKSMSRHLAPDRTPYLPWVPEAITDPHEVWASFERHKGTGKVVLRQRFLKMIRTDKDRTALLVTQAKGGIMEAWTMITSPNRRYMNNQRQGRLLFSKN
jgi:hypothetical protein